MNSEALDNLVKAKVLKAEPPDQAEFDGRTMQIDYDGYRLLRRVSRG
jgi:hypothetical protein